MEVSGTHRAAVLSALLHSTGADQILLRVHTELSALFTFVLEVKGQ